MQNGSPWDDKHTHNLSCYFFFFCDLSGGMRDMENVMSFNLEIYSYLQKYYPPSM